MLNQIAGKRKRTKAVNDSSDSEFSGFSVKSEHLENETLPQLAEVVTSESSADENQPSTSDGRRHRKRKKRRRNDGNPISLDNHSDWFTMERVTDRHHAGTNTDIRSFKVSARPDNSTVDTLADNQDNIEQLFATLITQVTSDSSEDAMVKFMLFSEHLDAPIRTAPAPLSDITPESILQAIEDVFQSNKEFILDDEFTFYAAVTHRPRGMGLRSHRIITAKEAVTKLRSVVNVKVKDGLCLPACLLLGQANAMGDTIQYEQWRKTERMPLRRAAAAYAESVLDRQIDPAVGCTFDDLDKFQEEIADSFQIKVFTWGPPTRKCIYAGTSNSDNPHYITLMFEKEHFNLISKLPGFFQSACYCHKCDKPYADERIHGCLNKCKGCLKQNCPDRDGKASLLCQYCNRYFPGLRCLANHKVPNQAGQRSICSRVKYCPACGRQQCEWGKRKNRHICGGIFCKNCDKYVDKKHRCYMKKYKEARS